MRTLSLLKLYGQLFYKYNSLPMFLLFHLLIYLLILGNFAYSTLSGTRSVHDQRSEFGYWTGAGVHSGQFVCFVPGKRFWSSC